MSGVFEGAQEVVPAQRTVYICKGSEAQKAGWSPARQEEGGGDVVRDIGGIHSRVAPPRALRRKNGWEEDASGNLDQLKAEEVGRGRETWK